MHHKVMTRCIAPMVVALALGAARLCASPPTTQPTTSRPTTSQGASNLPPAPDGFKWQSIKAINASFLLPKGWFYSRVEQKHTIAYRLTKEDSRGGKSFLTGLTINVTRNSSKVSHVKPSLYAVHFMQQYIKDADVLMEGKLDQIGKMQRLIFEVAKKIPETTAELEFRIRVVVIANDDTDTLYTLTFGSPVDEWTEEWKLGKRMLGVFLLDDDE